MKRFLCIVFGITTLVSCNTKNFDDPEKLFEYINDPKNKLTHLKTIKNVKVSVAYRPTDLIVNQFISSSITSLEEIDSLRNIFSNYLYFNISISKNNKELLSTIPQSKHEYGALVNELAFEFDNNINLISDKKDTLDVYDYIYPRLYGISEKTSMIVVFEKRRLKHAKTVRLNVFNLGVGIGELTFEFDFDSLKNSPVLNFNLDS